MLDGLAALKPRRERAHSDNGRVVGAPQRGPATHRVPDHDHLCARVPALHLGQRPPGVPDRVQPGRVPAPQSIPKPPHCDRQVADSLASDPGERDHPQLSQLPSSSPRLAAGLTARQHQHHRAHRATDGLGGH